MASIILFPLIVIVSCFFTELIRRYYVKKNILDIPDDRSSHSIPTPTGGGLSIVIVFLIVIGLTDTLPQNLVYALVGSGVLVAAVGFWDDKTFLPARLRLLIHTLAIVWMLYCLNDVERQFRFIGFNLHDSYIGVFIIVFLLVWMVNLFNFMDGIDGLTASETIFVSCAAAYFSWLQGNEYLSFISLSLAAATLGFLFLNWSPAKIFMGDVSSGFLGLILGVIAYEYILADGLAWTWVILLGVFITDSTLTLFVRIFNKKKLYEAHNSHAYQHAARRWGHSKVTLTVIFINVCWLFPLAVISNLYHDLAIYCALLALSPLIYISISLKAGVEK